jgi:pimeloyl-CoA synthetase
MPIEDTAKAFKEAVVTKHRFSVQINANAFAYTHLQVEGVDEDDALNQAYEMLANQEFLSQIVQNNWKFILDDCSPLDVDEAIQIS